MLYLSHLAIFIFAYFVGRIVGREEGYEEGVSIFRRPPTVEEQFDE